MANNNYLVYGGDLMLFVSTGSTNLQPLAFSTSSQLSINLGTREITSRDSGNWKDFLPGKLDWTTSSDALVNYVSTGTTQSADELFKYQTNRCVVNIDFAVKSGTNPSWTVDTSKKHFAGCGIITSLSISSQDGEQATYSISIQGSGELTLS